MRARGAQDEKKSPVPGLQNQGLMRSKSVQEPRGSGKGMGAVSGVGARKGPVPGQGQGQRRPLSIDGRDREREREANSVGVSNARRAVPRVAFGGAAVPTAPKTLLSKAGRDSLAPGAGQGQGVKAAVPVRKSVVGLAFGGRAPVLPSALASERDRNGGKGQGSEVPSRGRGVGPSPGPVAGVVRGPVIVTYDDDEVASYSNGNGKGNKLKVVDTKKLIGSSVSSGSGRGNGGNLWGGAQTGSKSRELNGESEYLRMGEGEDLISGDQLDRLLVQAKRVRAAPH